MTKFAKLLIIVLLASAMGPARGGNQPAMAAAKPEFGNEVFDFGHVGIDYTVHYRYPLVNRTADTLRVLGVKAHCDCSSVFCANSVLAPGDSTNIHLRFSTKNFYGPQNKSVTVMTDHPGMAETNLFYLSIIGQWFNGLRPDPLSVMILPPHKSKSVVIPNRSYGLIEIGDLYQLDRHFSVKRVTSKAKRNENLELEIIPSPDLRAGTFESNITVTVNVDDGDPVVMTIPVKIVRY